MALYQLIKMLGIVLSEPFTSQAVSTSELQNIVDEGKSLLYGKSKKPNGTICSTTVKRIKSTLQTSTGLLGSLVVIIPASLVLLTAFYSRYLMQPQKESERMYM